MLTIFNAILARKPDLDAGDDFLGNAGILRLLGVRSLFWLMEIFLLPATVHEPRSAFGQV
jgi:hypothetical protein